MKDKNAFLNLSDFTLAPKPKIVSSDIISNVIDADSQLKKLQESTGASKEQIAFLAEKQNTPFDVQSEKQRLIDIYNEPPRSKRTEAQVSPEAEEEANKITSMGDTLDADVRSGKISAKDASTQIRSAAKQFKERQSDRLTTSLLKGGEKAADTGVGVISTGLAFVPGGLPAAALMQTANAGSHYARGKMFGSEDENKQYGQSSDYYDRGIINSAIQAGTLGALHGAEKAIGAIAPMVSGAPVAQRVSKAATAVKDTVAPVGSPLRAAASTYNPVGGAVGGIAANELLVKPEDTLPTQLGKITAGMLATGYGLPGIISGAKGAIDLSAKDAAARRLGRAFSQEVESGFPKDIRDVPKKTEDPTLKWLEADERAAGPKRLESEVQLPTSKTTKPEGILSKLKKEFTPAEPTSTKMEFPPVYDPMTGQTTQQYGFKPPADIAPMNQNLPARKGAESQNLGLPPATSPEKFQYLKTVPRMETPASPKKATPMKTKLLEQIAQAIARQTAREIAVPAAVRLAEPIAARAAEPVIARATEPIAARAASAFVPQVAPSLNTIKPKPFSFRDIGYKEPNRGPSNLEIQTELERDFIPGKLPKQQISPFAEPAKPSNLEISLPTDNTSMSVSTIATPSTMSMPTAATTLAPSATSSVAPALMAAAIAVPKTSAAVAAFKAAAQNPVKQPQGTPMAKNKPQTKPGTAKQTGTPTNTPPTTKTGTGTEPKDERPPAPADEIKDNRYPVDLLTTKMGMFDPGQASGVKNAVNAHATKREREEFNLSLDPSRHMTDNQLGHPATRMPFGAYQLTRESTQVSLKDLVKEEIKKRIKSDDKLTAEEIKRRENLIRNPKVPFPIKYDKLNKLNIILDKRWAAHLNKKKSS